MPLRPFGTFIDSDEEIATLDNPLVDAVRLNDLRMEQAFAAAEIERLVAFGAGVSAGAMHDDTDPEVLANRSPRTNIRVGSTDLEVFLTEARHRLTAITARLIEENASTDRLKNASLIAPHNGLLWEVLADDGEFVQRGQDILKLMICDTALVTLSVPDTVYNRLRVGQNAKFRLNGTETLYDGTITRIAGAGAETIYRNLAVAPSIKHLERYDVALLVPELREDTDLRCTVGQTGRVFFETRPLDWARDLLK